MLNLTVGGNPGLELLLQQELLLERCEQKKEAKSVRIRGVWWLNEPKAAPKGAPPEEGSWTCPRCRSHRCIQTNPGDTREAIYRCCVCGYTFRGASHTRLLSPAG
jgi:DNA-directed RNA polymerase subunit M/transcription elongation factor TFIIS